MVIISLFCLCFLRPALKCWLLWGTLVSMWGSFTESNTSNFSPVSATPPHSRKHDILLLSLGEGQQTSVTSCLSIQRVCLCANLDSCVGQEGRDLYVLINILLDLGAEIGPSLARWYHDDFSYIGSFKTWHFSFLRILHIQKQPVFVNTHVVEHHCLCMRAVAFGLYWLMNKCLMILYV